MRPALLVPNLVWRSGRAAEHVRLAAMSGLARILPLSAIRPDQLERELDESLPVIYTAMEDDNVETRSMGCAVVEGLLLKLGSSRLEHERARKLYPELLKRLDDASDAVRVQACAPLRALFGAMSYSAIWTEQHNFDKTNYQYLLRGPWPTTP